MPRCLDLIASRSNRSGSNGSPGFLPIGSPGMEAGDTKQPYDVLSFDKSLPRIPGYPAELNQVWTNLIENARDAMDGEGTLTVRTRRDGDCVAVEIGDTGPGIAPEIRNRIFEPFFTTKPVGHGTGLGLDVSFRVVVNRHHGDLRVESEPVSGRGRTNPATPSQTLPLWVGCSRYRSSTTAMIAEEPGGSHSSASTPMDLSS